MNVKDFVKRNISETLLEELYFFRHFDKKRISKLKNCNEGKRCFILGNGPSLNKCDLSLLTNEFTFAVNSIFLKEDFVPTYYVVEDHHVARDNNTEISRYQPVSYKFIPRNYKHLIKSDSKTLHYNMNTGYYQNYSSNYCIPRFSADAASRMYCSQSVTMMCLQLAFHMGFNEVYLIGMDFNYVIPASAVIEEGGVILSTEDDPNHFDSAYFGAGKRWHDPHIDRVERSYILSKLCFEAHGRSIFNATEGGKLEVFERVSYQELF
jgi:hypothetical protein